ncbi:MAG: acyl-CoA thioesterase [Desulfomicrobium sp.]
MKKPYFKTAPGSPAPLRLDVERRIRFQEVDTLGIVWHGHYPSYFEDARVALGNHYGVGYLDFHRENVITPIKQLWTDYIAPLHFGESCTITAILHWTEAARINFEFEIRNQTGILATTGYTVQLFLDRAGNILTYPPDFYQKFLESWKKGEL